MAAGEQPIPTILAVDDEPEILEAYRRIFAPQKGSASRPATLFDSGSARRKPEEQRSSFRLLTAGQGEEAVELLRSHKNKEISIQAAFLVIRMPPGIDGLETAKRLRTIDPDLQIVIVTAFSDYPFYEIAAQLGKREALYYLEKPFTK
ncbi:MAG: response regulator, partial [bacterium]